MFLYGFAGASPLSGMLFPPELLMTSSFLSPRSHFEWRPLKENPSAIIPQNLFHDTILFESPENWVGWQNGPATRSPVPKEEGVEKGNETLADKENKDEKTKAVSFPLLKQPCCPCPLPSPHSDYPISLPELEVTGHSGGAEQKTLRYPERLRRADPLPARNCFKRTACFWRYRPRWRPSPKPTGLARRAEIWRLQSSYVPKLDCWKRLRVPNWCPLWSIWPRKMYILMPRGSWFAKQRLNRGQKSKHHLPEWRWNLIVCCTKLLSKSHLQLPWHVFKVVTGRAVI